MKLNHAIAKHIKTYPLLYRDVDYVKSRVKALSQLFIVNGNGLAWWDGFITDDCEMRYEEGHGWVGTSGKEYGKETFDDTFPDDYFTSNTIVTKKDNRGYESIFALTNECSRHPWAPYPISDGFAYILDIPDNIRTDWLEGANEISQYANQFWADKTRWHLDTYYHNINAKRKYGRLTKKQWMNYKGTQVDRFGRAQKLIDVMLTKRNMEKKVYVLPVWNESDNIEL